MASRLNQAEILRTYAATHRAALAQHAADRFDRGGARTRVDPLVDLGVAVPKRVGTRSQELNFHGQPSYSA